MTDTNKSNGMGELDLGENKSPKISKQTHSYFKMPELLEANRMNEVTVNHSIPEIHYSEKDREDGVCVAIAPDPADPNVFIEQRFVVTNLGKQKRHGYEYKHSPDGMNKAGYEAVKAAYENALSKAHIYNSEFASNPGVAANTAKVRKDVSALMGDSDDDGEAPESKAA